MESSTESPVKRRGHESAMIGDTIHLFGGENDKGYHIPRNEIWTCNVQKERKWIRHYAQGVIPPPCIGAQCVVIDGIIYSYGGYKEGGDRLGEIFGLSPSDMSWWEVGTPTHDKVPLQRSHCCLWAIGVRLIMFGGLSNDVPHDRLQSDAQYDRGVNNETYEFVFDERIVTGYWLDVELSGIKPRPRYDAAMETVDQHRGILHGGNSGKYYYDDAFMIDLLDKKWICIDFLPKPSARSSHRMCRLVKRGFEEKNLFLMIGGSKTLLSNSGHIIDFDRKKSHKIELTLDVAPVWLHTLHCLANEDGSASVILSGGQSGVEYKPIIETIVFGPSNESYMKIESLFLAESASIQSPAKEDRDSIRDVQQLMEKMSQSIFETLKNETQAHRERVDALQAEKSELAYHHGMLQRKYDKQSNSLRVVEEESKRQALKLQTLEDKCQFLQAQKDDIASQRQEFESRCQVLETQRQTLQNSLDESRNNLDKYLKVLSISTQQIQLTKDKLGTGAFAGVFVGSWNGMNVAVKKFHDLITTERTIPLFQNEVLTASRLRHPNIVQLFGAITKPGLPFQIVSELLEGSVSELIDAAHSSGTYLSVYEQLSIAADMTSAIAYMHELQPRPYVHGDIRPTNALVTRDMKAKICDLGATHLVDSSQSTGPLSPYYSAPERKAPTSGPSSLPSDVYSLGVALIEIFTGKAPVPEERSGQLSLIMNRSRLVTICSRMVGDEASVVNRPHSGHCLRVLKAEIDDCIKHGVRPIKRIVKGTFEGDEADRHHRVTLFDVYI